VDRTNAPVAAASGFARYIELTVNYGESTVVAPNNRSSRRRPEPRKEPGKFTAKDTKVAKDAPLARRLVSGVVSLDLVRAKRALVILVSLV
jgi:hypothetical protein